MLSKARKRAKARSGKLAHGRDHCRKAEAEAVASNTLK